MLGSLGGPTCADAEQRVKVAQAKKDMRAHSIRVFLLRGHSYFRLEVFSAREFRKGKGI